MTELIPAILSRQQNKILKIIDELFEFY